jgi:DNA mismatch endonuclease, patch repair protein
MASVRPTGNLTTELAFGKLLYAAGVRGYRKHWPILGKPDFAWPGRKVAVFVDGCFWHGCPKCESMPTSNVEFWKTKIENNRQRDQRVTRALRRDGWKVVRIRECCVKNNSSVQRVAALLPRT